MLYANEESNLLKIPRHTDEIIKSIEFVNQFSRIVNSISIANGDFSVDYSVPFYYAVKLTESLPLGKGTYTYSLKNGRDEVVETGNLQYDL